MVPARNMGRVNALIDPVMMLGHSMALGIVALAFPAWISVTWLHYILALCTVAVSFFYLFSLPSLVRKLEVQSAAEREASQSETA